MLASIYKTAVVAQLFIFPVNSGEKFYLVACGITVACCPRNWLISYEVKRFLTLTNVNIYFV